MRMLSSWVNAELGEDLTAEGVVRDHSLHSTLNEQLGAALTNTLNGLTLFTTDITRNGHVLLLGFFTTSQTDILGIDHDHMVAGINVRGEDGLVLAAQNVGGSHGHITEDLIFGVDDVPLTGLVLGFG